MEYKLKRILDWKNALLLFVIFSILFLGAIQIGPISIRNLCALGLLYPILIGNGIKTDINVRCYFIYLVFLIASNIFSGQILGNDFLKNFFSGHFVCIIIVLAIPLLIKTKEQLESVVLLCVCCYIFNSIISILQFYNVKLGWSIGLLINPGALKFMNMAEYYMNGADNFLNRSIVYGLTGFVVQNGYFSTVFLPIATNTLFVCTGNKRNMLFAYFILFLGIVTIYMIQQRMAFALLILFLLSLIYLKTGAFTKTILIGASIVTFALATTTFDLDMGRLTTNDISSDSRMNQIDNFVDFFNSNNFPLGASLDEKSLGDSLGHNTLLDSLRRGGFLTFIIYIITFFVILINCVRTCFLAYKEKYKYTFAFATSCVIFMLYSFTHSTGIQSGAVYFWFVYSMMVISNSIESENESIIVN